MNLDLTKEELKQFYWYLDECTEYPKYGYEIVFDKVIKQIEKELGIKED